MDEERLRRYAFDAGKIALLALFFIAASGCSDGQSNGVASEAEPTQPIRVSVPIAP